jgi:NADH-quinone oxidoreductase subunit N
VFLSIASMLLGAFAAIGQTNIKRLMAYSSIGHVGYALIGLAADSEAGSQAVLVYLAIYLFMTLGAFACILSMRGKDGMVEDIDSLAGLARTNLPMAFVLAMVLFSMAGIPPLAGFFAKFYVFAAAIQAGLYTLAVIGVLTSVVAAYYYIRIVIVMFVSDAKQSFLPMDRGANFVMIVSGLFVLLFVFAPAPLVDAALSAARSLQSTTIAGP